MTKTASTAIKSIDISFPPELPITARLEEIADTLSRHPVLVVAGETGSGKSTQLPKLCLKLFGDQPGLIAHTQPRRIAAREIASRVSRELQQTLGHLVGYKIRFHERTSDETRIKVLTDGMLLAEFEHDRSLKSYHTIIVDEAHERSVNIDFILGFLKRLRRTRPELRILITSATIDTERFSRHFDDCPVIEVSGRTYPVETRYRPLAAADVDDNLFQGVAAALRELWSNAPGDALVFLPGEREIRDCGRYLKRQIGDELEVLPLYARLAPPDQKRIFSPSRGKRVVLSTNVAETSLTVPGVRYVVDSGLARISRYSPTRKVLRLPIEKVSQASANQRKGRCGRVSSGICIRLYDEEDFDARSEFTDAEIGRTSLASVILRMKSLGLGEVENFPFIDMPNAKQVTSGIRLLHEIGALNEQRKLTGIGRTLARLPVDPRIGRLLIEARRLHCLADMLVVAARLSVQDPQIYPPDKTDVARGHHRRFPEANNDIEAILELWREYKSQSAELSRRKLSRWCEENYLSPFRMREWQDLHEQLSRISRDGLDRRNKRRGSDRSSTDVTGARDSERDFSAIGQSLLSGFLGNIAMLSDRGTYSGTGGKILSIHPASRSFKKKPKWLVAAELMDSGKLYARQILPVHPVWIERAAGSLIRHDYAEPWWDRKSGNVMAWQSGTLFGLRVFSRRRQNFGRVNPGESRKIFISEALVTAELEAGLGFARKNRSLFAEAEKLSRKLRMPADIQNDGEIFDFFDARIPGTVFDQASLKRWLKQEPARAEALVLPREMVIDESLSLPDGYPDQVELAGARVPVEYRFSPGEPDDGITLKIPLPLLNQLNPDESGLQLRGWLQQHVEALIRCLPKSRRRPLVPIPEHAKRLAQSISGADGLVEELVSRLQSVYGLKVSTTDFDLSRLPDHLRLRIELVDQQGRVVDSGRDVQALRQAHGSGASEAFDQIRQTGYPRSGIRQWDFGNLPDSVSIRGYGSGLKAYPGLADRGKSVELLLFDNAGEAADSHHAGTRRLFKLQLKGALKDISVNFGLDRLAVRYAGLYPAANLLEDFQDALIDNTFGLRLSAIRTQAGFEKCLDENRGQLREAGLAMSKAVDKALEHAYSLKQDTLLRKENEFTRHIIGRVDALIGPGFLVRTPAECLCHVPRYMQCLVKRCEKYRQNPLADVQLMQRIMPYVEALEAAAESSNAEDLRWLIEEFYVSLFAQSLGTSRPVSAKRLDVLVKQL